ncbi:hypothetical protein Droror1_Dr00025496, partial [Drosera rotundifolia]
KIPNRLFLPERRKLTIQHNHSTLLYFVSLIQQNKSNLPLSYLTNFIISNSEETKPNAIPSYRVRCKKSKSNPRFALIHLAGKNFLHRYVFEGSISAPATRYVCLQSNTSKQGKIECKIKGQGEYQGVPQGVTQGVCQGCFK